MTRPSQRQLLDAMNRAVERAGRDADARYGIKSAKARPKAKTKPAKKPLRKARAAAE